MPQIFKGLATINAWALFVAGWLSLIAGYVQLIGIYVGVNMAPSGAPSIIAILGGGFLCLTLSVVVMKLRHMMS